jgi:hypothetical protein
MSKTVTGALSSFLLLTLLSGFVVAESAEGKQEWVDRDGFPESYSILTSDHIMFPDDVTNWPMKIDSTRQLFVDDYVITSMENLVRQFHQPVKHAKNPLIVADKAWESEAPERI